MKLAAFEKCNGLTRTLNRTEHVAGSQFRRISRCEYAFLQQLTASLQVFYVYSTFVQDLVILFFQHGPRFDSHICRAAILQASFSVLPSDSRKSLGYPNAFGEAEEYTTEAACDNTSIWRVKGLKQSCQFE
jgi:hypothetical protein